MFHVVERTAARQTAFSPDAPAHRRGPATTVRRRGAHLAALCLAAFAVSASGLEASAQAYPSRPVRIVIGFAPGGAVDILGRVMAQKLSDKLGVSFFVENRPGANANLGAESVARAAPDGQTVLMVTTSHALSAITAENLSFNPVDDFAPITLIASVPNVVMVNAKVPVNSLQELIDLLKKEPGRHNYASTGIGGATHLAAESFKVAAQVDMVHVPYKGAGPALNAVLTGEVTAYFGSVSGAKGLASTGQLKVLAITADKRSAALSQVPTTAEAGLPQYQFATWYGLLAPAKTPPAIVGKLRDEVVSVLRSPDIQTRLEVDGAVPIGGTPEEFKQFLKDEIVRLGPIVKAAGVTGN